MSTTTLSRPTSGSTAVAGETEGTAVTPFANCRHFRSARSIASTSRSKPKWIVRGLIRANTSNTVLGPPGGGKSVFSDGLGIALTQGDAEWCGYTLDYAGPVAYLTGDPGEDDDTSERIDGLDAQASERAGVLAIDKARAKDRSYWEELKDDLLSAGVGVIFIDNAYSVAPADTDHDKPQGARPFLEDLDTFIRAGIAVVLVQHTPKGNPKKMRDGAGSQAYSAWTRNAVRLTLRSPGRIDVQVVKKNRETAPDAVLAMSVVDGVPRFTRTNDEPSQARLSSGAARTRAQTTLDQRAELADYYLKNLTGMKNVPAASVLHREYGTRYSLAEDYIRTGLGMVKGQPGWLRAAIDERRRLAQTEAQVS